MPRIVPRVHHPVLRLLGGVEQPLESHLRRSLRRQQAQCHGCTRDNAQHVCHTQNCHFGRSRPTIFLPSLHCAPPFSLAASKNAMRSFKSFSGRLFASYTGIKDSRVFSNDRSLAFSNECNSSRVSNI